MEKTQRIAHIDFIRGCALLGILLINIQTYTLHFFLPEKQIYLLGLDQPEIYRPLKFFISWLVHGQFYTIYSFLFGLGFWFLLNKYKDENSSFGTRLFKKRLWLLLAMGLIHGLVFWLGDILHNYAILGFTLLYFNKKEPKTIWKWIIGFVILFILFNCIKYGFFITEENILQERKEFEGIGQELIKTITKGTFWEILGFQKIGVMIGTVIDVTGGFSFSTPTEIMFLLGLITGKAKVFFRLQELKPKFRKIVLTLIIPALAIKGVSCLNFFGIEITQSLVWNEFIEKTTSFIGILLLAVCYLCLFALLYRANPLTRAIANTGRFGLTNYLGQTILCMLLFYPYAFGLSGKTSLWQALLIAFTIYILQIIISNIYIRYNSIGPIEKIWRNMALKMMKSEGRKKEI